MGDICEFVGGRRPRLPHMRACPMPVRKRLNLVGPAVAFVTTTVYDWQPVLTREDVAPKVTGQLKETLSVFRVAVFGWVIMPSHVHLLLGFPEIENLSRCVQSFKSLSSRRIKELRLEELARNDYKLWRPRFDDLIICTETQYNIKMEYIHNNPVKAGLVSKAEDWPYSSAVDWLTERRGLLGIDKEHKWLAKK